MTGWLLKSWSAAHARVAPELNIVQIIRKRVRNLANYNSPKRWRTRCPNPLKWVEIHLKWKERFCRSGIPMRYCMTSQMGRTQAYRFFLLFELRYRSFFWFILPSRCSAVCTFPAVKMQAAIITIVLPSPPNSQFSIYHQFSGTWPMIILIFPSLHDALLFPLCSFSNYINVSPNRKKYIIWEWKEVVLNRNKEET